jgi:hypothetical protein
MQSCPCTISRGVGTDTGRSISAQLTAEAAAGGAARTPASKLKQASSELVSVGSKRTEGTFQDEKPRKAKTITISDQKDTLGNHEQSYSPPHPSRGITIMDSRFGRIVAVSFGYTGLPAAGTNRHRAATAVATTIISVSANEYPGQ